MALWAILAVSAFSTLVRLACGADVTVNTPSNVRECEPVTLSWSDPSSSGPYQVSVLPVGGPASEYSDLTLWLQDITGTSVSWTPDRASGSTLAVHVRNKNSVVADSNSFTMASGKTNSCVVDYKDNPTTSSTTSPQAVITTTTTPAAQTTIVTTTNQGQATTVPSAPTSGPTLSSEVRTSSSGSSTFSSQSTALAAIVSVTSGASSSPASLASSSSGSPSGLLGSPTATDATSPSSNSKMPTGTIVGIAIGALAVLALLVTILFFWLKRSKRHTVHPPEINTAERGSPPESVSGSTSRTASTANLISPFYSQSSDMSRSPLTAHPSSLSKSSYTFNASGAQPSSQESGQMAQIGYPMAAHSSGSNGSVPAYNPGSQGVSYTPVDSKLAHIAPPGYTLNP